MVNGGPADNGTLDDGVTGTAAPRNGSFPGQTAAPAPSGFRLTAEGEPVPVPIAAPTAATASSAHVDPAGSDADADTTARTRTPASATRSSRRRVHRPRRVIEKGPWLIAAGAFVLYSLLGVLRYERRATSSWDLGIFTEAVKQYAHFRAPVVEIRGHDLNLLGDHFHPILATLAPFFRIFPSPVTLLVGQAFLLAVAAVPITRTAMDLVGRGAGYAIGGAYALSWGIVEAANFDFHEVAFAVPLLAFSLTNYLRGEDHDLKTVLWALPLILVKEDVALLAPVICGLVVARRRFANDPLARAAVTAAGVLSGLALMMVIVRVVIPHYNPQGTYLYWADSGCLDPAQHNGIGKLLTCVPDQLMDASGTKTRTVMLTLLPVAFIALRSPLALLVVPGLAARFVNVKDVYWGTDYHYAAVPMAILFVAAIDGLVRLRRSRERAAAANGLDVRAPRAGTPRTGAGSIPSIAGDALLRHGPAAMLAIGVALTQNFPLQDLWQSDTWQQGDRAVALKRAERVVPDGVSVETTIDMLAPLAARTETMWMGNANNLGPAPEYIAFDLGKQDWGGRETPLEYANVRHAGVRYEEVYSDPQWNVYVFRQSAGQTD